MVRSSLERKNVILEEKLGFKRKMFSENELKNKSPATLIA